MNHVCNQTAAGQGSLAYLPIPQRWGERDQAMGFETRGDARRVATTIGRLVDQRRRFSQSVTAPQREHAVRVEPGGGRAQPLDCCPRPPPHRPRRVDRRASHPTRRHRTMTQPR